MDQAQIQKGEAQGFRLARRLMKIRTARTTTGAAQAHAQLDGGIALAKARYQVSRIDEATVLAPAAGRNQRHLSPHEFAERPALASLPGIAVAWSHFVRLLHQWKSRLLGFHEPSRCSLSILGIASPSPRARSRSVWSISSLAMMWTTRPSRSILPRTSKN